MSDPRLHVAVIAGNGTGALQPIIQSLPARVNLAVVIACAGVPDLSSALRAATSLPIIDAHEAVELEPQSIYLIPEHRDAWFEGRRLVVDGEPSQPAPVDRLLRTLADEHTSFAAAVVLSGIGTDGAIGIKRVKEAGGVTMAVTPGSVPESEMSRAAVATGMVDFVLPLADIAPRLSSLAQEDLTDRGVESALVSDPIADTLRDILTMIRIRSGHDFSSYKRATLYRRVARRMQVCRAETLAEYHSFLRDHPAELANVLRDFLISVTNFFRDPEAFEVLAARVVPKLFDNKQPNDQVRVWVAGCATGEEAYSIGMLLAEYASHLHQPPQIQIFATDIDEEALAEGRAGRYPSTIANDVSPDRLERFFTRENEHYRITKELREMMLFSPHNVLRDPPFSRIDLASFRNVLIYLNRDAQDRALNTFHFGLRHEGYLFLGSSESAESATQQFSTLDVKQRIFIRRAAPSALRFDSVLPSGRWQQQSLVPATPPESRLLSFGELHHRLVERYAPPSVLVNEELDVVHVSEHAGKFMTVSGGEPTRQVLRLVHPALRLDLRTAIYAARQPGVGADSRAVRFDEDGKTRQVTLHVKVADLPELGRNTILVLFDESSTAVADRMDPDPPSVMEPVVRELETELHRTRDQLRTTIEQYETSLEELKASNEELHAINEELRSATEELETSKEELQAVNEELTTLNHELKLKIEEVSRANSDLQNLMTSTDIGVVFLDRHLHIKRFTARAQELFNVIPSDIGRPLAHLTHHLDTDQLPALASTVLQTLRTNELELESRDGKRYLARFLPYRSLEDRIEGVVLTFIEVTDLRAAIDARRRSEVALRASEDRLRFSLRDTPIVVLSYDRDLRLLWGFAGGREIDTRERSLELFTADHGPRFRELLQDAIATRSGRRDELAILMDGSPRTYEFRIEALEDGVRAVGYDVTASRLAEQALRDADRRKDEFLATLSHELRNPLTPLKVALDVARLAQDRPKQLGESLDIIERQVDQLTQLVDDLLDVSRITQGKLVLERAPLDPAGLVDEVLEAVGPAIRAAHHELSVQLPNMPCRVLGDRRRLVQVLTNLLLNAAKYTHEQGKIEIVLQPTEEDLEIRVRDNGLGIEAETLPHIFDLFVQARDTLGRARGGIGIGLNVVRRLVELHGGTVTASSAGTGHGSEFLVRLPLARST